MRGVLILLILAAQYIHVSGQQDREAFINDLLSKMTLEEKVGQMTLYTSDWDVTGPTLRENYVEDIKSGRCGNIFNAHTVAYNRELQRIAIEESRLGIPLLFGYDVIHGHKTIFPIPLGESCSWDLDLIRESSRLAAKEASASGLSWTFNPMVDIARDPRWGRIAEGSGEDPYLASLIAAAKVEGYQGDDLSSPETVMACVKHFAAYGAAQAGRDYHTVDISERALREIYLPPFKAALDAGVGSVMTSFNEYDGIPVSGSKFLMTDVLRTEWNFDGFVVTDYTSINEMIPHGYARDERHAGELAVEAGVDMDMQGAIYHNHMASLVESGEVEEELIDEAVRRILNKKYALGLFEDPYNYFDEEREAAVVLSDELIGHAREAGRKSIVLLKNEPVNGQPLLPINDNVSSIALIGPLADVQEDMLGTWHAAGDERRVVTLKNALVEAFPGVEIKYTMGASTETMDESGFAEALEFVQACDLVITALGENYRQNGEAASRSDLGLPGAQQALLEAIHATGKPVITLVMAGRPLVLTWMDEHIPAILNTWHLGTMAGPAIADVLTGAYNPSAKLTATFPRNVGQIPIYLSMKNTGRPFDANNKYTSKYLDVTNEPLYPFGFGLSYTTFTYSNLVLSRSAISGDQAINIRVDITNTGPVAGEETVQLYVRDMVGSVTRPVKELKGFEKVYLDPGQQGTVTFKLTKEDLRFYNPDMMFTAEAGEFRVFVGGSSDDTLEGTFQLLDE